MEYLRRHLPSKDDLVTKGFEWYERVYGKGSFFEDTLQTVDAFVPDGYTDELRAFSKGPDTVFILYSNHISQGDGLAHVPVAASILNAKIPGIERGFCIPGSLTMGNGRQGAVLQKFYPSHYDWMLSKGVTVVPVANSNDKLIGENTDPENIELLTHLEPGYGLIFLPESTMKGGRIDENGMPYGRQKVKEFGMVRLARWYSLQGREVVLCPAAIEGTDRISSPGIEESRTEGRGPTIELLLTLGENKARTKIGRSSHKLARVTALSPFNIATLKDAVGNLRRYEEASEYCMQRIDEALPPRMRRRVA